MNQFTKKIFYQKYLNKQSFAPNEFNNSKTQFAKIRINTASKKKNK